MATTRRRPSSKTAARRAPKRAPKRTSKPALKGSKSARPSIGTFAGRARVARTAALIGLEKLVLAAFEDMKAVDIRLLDVRGLTDVADTMIVCSGTSDRHVRAIAELVIERAKAAGRRPLGTEGKQDAEWVLVDLQDVLVHVMLPRVREFYALEELWEAPAAARRAAPVASGPPSG
jgi:ribosome-associated protein